VQRTCARCEEDAARQRELTDRAAAQAAQRRPTAPGTTAQPAAPVQVQQKCAACEAGSAAAIPGFVFASVFYTERLELISLEFHAEQR
jgi:hypothetical protein